MCGVDREGEEEERGDPQQAIKRRLEMDRTERIARFRRIQALEAEMKVGQGVFRGNGSFFFLSFERNHKQ